MRSGSLSSCLSASKPDDDQGGHNEAEKRLHPELSGCRRRVNRQGGKHITMQKGHETDDRARGEQQFQSDGDKPRT